MLAKKFRIIHVCSQYFKTRPNVYLHFYEQTYICIAHKQN